MRLLDVRPLTLAGFVSLACAGCSANGASVTQPSAPAQTVRAALQAATLAEQAAIVLVPAAGGPSYFGSTRAPASRGIRAGAPTACSQGYAEQDTPSAQTVHIVQLFFFDPACATLRAQATLDRALGVDTSTMNGAIASFDAAGNATVNQTVSASTFASGGGFLGRDTTDALPGAGAPFGRSSMLCAPPNTCTLVAVISGAQDTGVRLNLHVTPAPSGAAGSLTVDGSISTAPRGALTLVPRSGFTPPSLAGGTTIGTITANASIVPAPAGPTALTLSLDAASVHVDGKIAGGSSVFTAADGSVVTLNANGDGTAAYAGGSSERVLDYRIGV